ncbi:glycoside hydrolase family 13 protein [Murinocardiopsis flavida]|nr:glycoside hydrolase family 13 protein [Murinocardiopsis flavida]
MRRIPTGSSGGATGWWRAAAIYQIYVRSFADADGDGTGDLAGVRERLPWLAALGIDAVWLTPFYDSPMADGGYDVADYRAVDPRFGTLADFDRMLATAHGLGLRVIVDIVPNHTSSEHRWFAEALEAGPGSAARKRYIFRDGRGPDGAEPPNDWPSIFGGRAWTRLRRPDGTPEEWYLHLFDPAQPDLNWDNPEVRAEFEDVLRFWLDRGVDGFRIDVAHGLVKPEGLPDMPKGYELSRPDNREMRRPYFDQDGVHEIYRQWRRILDSYPGERVAVAEAKAATPARAALYLRPDELHQAFNFDYLGAPWQAPVLRRIIDASLQANASVDAPTTWALSNHDVVRQVTRFGGGEPGLRRARAAALLTLALPGAVYLYQGEELGLPEVLDLPEEVLEDPAWERSGRTDRGRDGCRVPLPWEGPTAPFGFGPVGTKPWLPVPEGWRRLSREVQASTPGSTLELYTTALRLRRELPALGAGTGGIDWLSDPAADVLTFARSPGFACVVNFGAMPIRPPLAGEPLLSSAPVAAEDDGSIRVPPDTAVWLRAAAAA